MAERTSPTKLSHDDKLQRMIAVAELRYGPNPLSEKEIAVKLRCSPNSVSRILKDAFRQNVIDVRINRISISEIRKRLMDRFRLVDARISPFVPNPDATRSLIAIEAAKYFNEVLKEHQAVAISGGRTLHQMVDSIGSQPRDIQIYPLTGLWRDLRINYVDSGALVHYLWMKCEDRAEAFWFPTEPISDNTSAEAVSQKRESYFSNPDVKAVYDGANNVDLAFIGIAPLRRESSTIRQLEKIGITYEFLTDRGAVGVAGGIWFDKEAKPVLEDYFLSVPLDTFQKMCKERGKKAVVVAGGEEKVDAIRVFLNQDVCNVLITDGRTARLLLTDLS